MRVAFILKVHPIMKYLALLLSLLATATVALGSNTMRTWRTNSGTAYRAELVTYDEAKKLVTLRLEDETIIELGHDEFSAPDRAWLLEWTEFLEEKLGLLKKLGGVITTHEGKGKYRTDYWDYQPPLVDPQPGTKPPMLILFHPNGNGYREIFRYIEAAKAAGLTLVSCDYFRNSPSDVLDGEMQERFEELLPQIEAAVPHDANRMFMGGCSGGAMRAYGYSATVKRPWAGIYANCGWLGGPKYYNLPYPKMRVAMVNGNEERDRVWVAPDSEVLNKAGCTITIHAFEGGHQVPPPSVQEKAFRWLLGDE